MCVLRTKSEEKDTLVKGTRVGEEKKHTLEGNGSRYFDHKKEKVYSQKERVEGGTIMLVTIITT